MTLDSLVGFPITKPTSGCALVCAICTSGLPHSGHCNGNDTRRHNINSSRSTTSNRPANRNANSPLQFKRETGELNLVRQLVVGFQFNTLNWPPDELLIWQLDKASAFLLLPFSRPSGCCVEFAWSSGWLVVAHKLDTKRDLQSADENKESTRREVIIGRPSEVSQFPSARHQPQHLRSTSRPSRGAVRSLFASANNPKSNRVSAETVTRKLGSTWW